MKDNIELGIPSYTNDGVYCGQSITFSTSDIDNKKHVNYKFLTRCKNYVDLSKIESVLFSLEFKNNPGLEPFYILVNNEKFCYNIINEFGKYYIEAIE